jgi:hypothetical protein
MDERTFDHVVRTIGTPGSRRLLFGVGAALPVAGLLAALSGEDSAARRKHGRNRGHRPGKKKDNRKGRRNNGGGLGGGEETTCLSPQFNLQYAVDQARDGDTLTLCAGNFPEQTLNISKNLTIVGAGSGQTSLTESQSINSNLAVTNGVTVTVQGLTITGWGTERVSAVNNEGSLILADVVVMKSRSDNAVANLVDATLHLTQGSAITGNSGGGNGVGIANDGGQVTIDAGCSVTGNSAGPGGVGGIFSDTGSNIILADNSIVTNNFEDNCGTADDTEITNCNQF